MMQVLNPTYTIRLEIKDVLPTPQQVVGGQGQLAAANIGVPARKWYGSAKTGCDEVLAAVRKALGDAGLTASLTFEKFEHT